MFARRAENNVAEQALLLNQADSPWYAAKTGALEKIMQLFPGQNVYEKGPVGDNVFHVAMLVNTPSSLAIARYLVQLYGTELINCPYQERTRYTDPPGLYEGETALHIAIVNRDFDMVKYLVQNGADVRARAFGKFFARGRPCYYGEYPVSFAASLGLHDICAYLKRHGAHVSDRDSYGNTALHLCVFHNRQETYDYLVTYLGAREDLRNHDGRTPLLLAAELGHRELFQHIYTRSRKLLWAYGPVSAWYQPLRDIDTVVDEAQTAHMSAVEAVCHNCHVHMLQDFVIQMVVETKWKKFAGALAALVCLGRAALAVLLTALVALHGSSRWETRAADGLEHALLALFVLFGLLLIRRYMTWLGSSIPRIREARPRSEIIPLYAIPGENIGVEDRGGLFSGIRKAVKRLSAEYTGGRKSLDRDTLNNPGGGNTLALAKATEAHRRRVQAEQSVSAHSRGASKASVEASSLFATTAQGGAMRQGAEKSSAGGSKHAGTATGGAQLVEAPSALVLQPQRPVRGRMSGRMRDDSGAGQHEMGQGDVDRVLSATSSVRSGQRKSHGDIPLPGHHHEIAPAVDGPSGARARLGARQTETDEGGGRQRLGLRGATIAGGGGAAALGRVASHRLVKRTPSQGASTSQRALELRLHSSMAGLDDPSNPLEATEQRRESGQLSPLPSAPSAPMAPLTTLPNLNPPRGRGGGTDVLGAEPEAALTGKLAEPSRAPVDTEEQTATPLASAFVHAHRDALRHRNEVVAAIVDLAMMATFLAHYGIWFADVRDLGDAAASAGGISSATASAQDALLAVATLLSYLMILSSLQAFLSPAYVMALLESAFKRLLRFVAVYLPINVGFAVAFYALHNGLHARYYALPTTGSARLDDIPGAMVSVFRMLWFDVTYEDVMQVNSDGLRVVACAMWVVYMVVAWLLVLGVFNACLVKLVFDGSAHASAGSKARLAHARAVLSLERMLPRSLQQRFRLGDAFHDPRVDSTVYWLMYETVKKDGRREAPNLPRTHSGSGVSEPTTAPVGSAGNTASEA
ncbi:unnamed protein product [Pedinophyceae sp. YPF-701]|nr:unnamed protein product [Pedinophyceae sp. YPF-701]